MAPRYVCIHGHFYQPPREDPWLGVIPIQESAAPFENWNRRIAAECYAPNARAGNFERISFNIGPTLLTWLAEHEPETYSAIIDADRRGCERYGGHGPAIAQVYNHIIMPLANERDRRTQVRWGIADFRHRFGREPEGMWLAETAVDTPTLESLAAEGIAFTILSPQQARRIRPTGSDSWSAIGRGRIDPSRAYLCPLPSGRSIALFFYDAPVSSGIAFDGLLNSGARFTGRLLGAFDDRRDWPQLVHVATDGETYGHHSRHGVQALECASTILEEQTDVKLTTYGEFLTKHPPEYEVQIIEDSAWSCAHGLGRWCDDCGCRYQGGTSQAWRRPLREALDWLRDELSGLFEAEFRGDPWAARDGYIDAILNPALRNESAHQLLEMQHFGLLMSTSCGWFFDDIAGLEAVQNLRYAARAIEIAESISPLRFAAGIRDRLAAAPCNDPRFAHGGEVWDNLLRRV